MATNRTFHFSATVLNHLGRNLYRNFLTVLGEAISNSWDADAKNVWITIDKNTRTMRIIDDGCGMSSDDIDQHFLRIGYSKRGADRTNTHSPGKRPYIGAKGIGKLALLSCAEAVHVVSTTNGVDYDGCSIDNREIDKAVDFDRDTSEIDLPDAPGSVYSALQRQHSGSGTAIEFAGLKPSINQTGTLRYAIARAFRFALIDSEFSIYLDGDKIDENDLKDLGDTTQLAWKIGDLDDPLLGIIHQGLTNADKPVPHRYESRFPEGIRGFIAMVDKPTSRKVHGTDNTLTLDLYVNGRLREVNVTQHIPSAQVAENYVYGQLHYDALDKVETDVFTSSREGIIADDPDYKKFLKCLRKELSRIYDHWDDFRTAQKRTPSDDEMPPMDSEAAAEKLADTVMKKFVPEDLPKDNRWRNLARRAKRGVQQSTHNYAELYTLENLMRHALKESGVDPAPRLNTDQAKGMVKRQTTDVELANEANLGNQLRKHHEDLWFINFAQLLTLPLDEVGINPKVPIFDLSKEKGRLLSGLRNVVMHTSEMTDRAQEAFSAFMVDAQKAVKQLVARG